jgi:hypothetical protein
MDRYGQGGQARLPKPRARKSLVRLVFGAFFGSKSPVDGKF